MGVTGATIPEPIGWRFRHGRYLGPAQSKGVVAGRRLGRK